jgi:hypothetical protein
MKRIGPAPQFHACQATDNGDADRSVRARQTKWAIAATVAGTLLIALALDRARPVDGRTSLPPAVDSPRDLITRLVTAVQAGDRQTFYECFADANVRGIDGGGMHDPSWRLHNELFSRRGELRGHALSDMDVRNDATASFVLELICRSENLRCEMELRRIDGNWKVERLRQLNRSRPEILYGTPVTGQN